MWGVQKREEETDENFRWISDDLLERIDWTSEVARKKGQETTQEETTDGRKHGGGCGVDFEPEKSTWHLLQ